MAKRSWHDDVLKLHEEGFTPTAIRAYLSENRGVDVTEQAIQGVTGSNNPLALAKNLNTEVAVDVVYEYTKDYRLIEELQVEAKEQQKSVLADGNLGLWLKMQQFRLSATGKRIDALTNLATASRIRRDEALSDESDETLKSRVIRETVMLIEKYPDLWPRLLAAVEKIPPEGEIVVEADDSDAGVRRDGE